MSAAWQIQPIGKPMLVSNGTESSEVGFAPSIVSSGWKYSVSWQSEGTVKLQNYWKGGFKRGDAQEIGAGSRAQVTVVNRKQSVVVYDAPDADADGVFLRSVSRGKVGDAVQLNKQTANLQQRATTCTLKTKRGEGEKIVVAWADFSNSTAGELHVSANIFDASGKPLREEFRVTEGAFGLFPVVVCLKEGGFIVSWLNFAQAHSALRKFNNNGETVGETVVLEGTEETPFAVISDHVQMKDGNIMITYGLVESPQVGISDSVNAQVMSVDGKLIGKPILIAKQPGYALGGVKIVALGEDSFVAVWTAFVEEGEEYTLLGFGQAFNTKKTIDDRFQIGSGLESNEGIDGVDVTAVKTFGFFKQFVVAFVQVESDEISGRVYTQKYGGLIF